jgi:formamidopyrimidine-DNA glycosylase
VEETMPELPDLEWVRHYLSRRVIEVSIEEALVRRPIVVRNLLGGDAAEHMRGRTFCNVLRRGKYLILSLDDFELVIQPMLAGRLYYGPPKRRHRKRDALVLALDDGHELRYHDAKDMGKIYLTRDRAQIPAYTSLGPEATDPDLALEAFRARFERERGEIKDVLARQRFVAGIGSAYADEICWRAQIYPFRRRGDLSEREEKDLYHAMRSVLSEAIQTIRKNAKERIDIELRDFMAVHGKAGQPCPRCGTPISEVRRSRRPTHFCRTCQPGLIVGR